MSVCKYSALLHTGKSITKKSVVPIIASHIRRGWLGENWALILNSSQTEQNMKHNSKTVLFSAKNQQLHPEKFRPQWSSSHKWSSPQPLKFLFGSSESPKDLLRHGSILQDHNLNTVKQHSNTTETLQQQDTSSPLWLLQSCPFY